MYWPWVAGCQQPPSANENDEPTQVDPPEPTAHVARVRFAASADAANAGDFKENFTLLGQRDIAVVIDVDTTGIEPVSGVYFMRFDILNPSGVPLQTQYHAFSYDAGAPASLQHPETQKVMKVTRVTSDDGWVNFRTFIHVAGTSFTRNRLLGEFTAAAYVGLAAEMPSVAATFEMGL